MLPPPSQALSPNESIVFLEDTSHCRDMRSSSPDDPQTVQWAHSKIRGRVSKWLRGSSAEAEAEAAASPASSADRDNPERLWLPRRGGHSPAIRPGSAPGTEQYAR